MRYDRCIISLIVLSSQGHGLMPGSIGLECMGKDVKCRSQSVAIQHISDPHLPPTQFLIMIEASSRRQHDGFAFMIIFSKQPPAEVHGILHWQLYHIIECRIWQIRLQPRYLSQTLMQNLSSLSVLSHCLDDILPTQFIT